jgi:hypothetical protein
MTTLTELSSTAHGNLKIVPNAIMDFISKQHVLSLMAVEIGSAAACFPVFVARSSKKGTLSFSAMTSFDMGENLFVVKRNWEGVFLPSCLRTYPLVLMQSPKDPKQFTVGFDEKSDAVSTSQGSVLFDAEGKASPLLSDVTKLLETELGNVRQNYELGKTLENLNLLKQVNINVQYHDGSTNVIKGLQTINQEVLGSLKAQQLEQLNKAGYLTPIYGLIISLYQLNALMTKNNAIAGKAKVASIKMSEVS